MSSTAESCQKGCSDALEKQIRVAIEESLSGTVENIYFQQDANYKTNMMMRGDAESRGDPVPLTHRFLLSFVIPCPSVSNPKKVRIMDEPKEVIAAVSPAPEADPKPFLSAVDCCDFDCPDMSCSPEPTGNICMIENNGVDDPLESSMISHASSTGNATVSGASFSDVMDFQSGLFPLSTEKLHATIDEQLSKSSPYPNVDWRSSLFNDVAPTETDGKMKSPLHQSSEVSSSSGARLVSFVLPLQSTNMNSTRQLVCVNSATKSATNPQIYFSTNLPAGTAIPQQMLCPAKLPAVSALVSGKQSLQWTLAKTPTNKASMPTFVRYTKQFQTPKSKISSRPSLLLPKFVAKTSTPSTAPTAKVRCRKKNPLPKSKDPLVQAPSEVSQFSDLPNSTPSGHTYESWILQEGLYKVRQQGLHKTEDPEAYPYACPACDKRYKNPNGIKYHAKYAHGPKSIFFCEICKREYATRHGLSAHKKSHINLTSAENQTLSNGNIGGQPASATVLFTVPDTADTS